jgi:hypothetical protein
MVDEPQNTTHAAESDDDTYELLPPEPVEVKPTAPLYGPDPEELLEEEPPEEREGFQFSLRELFVIMTAAAAALGVVSSLPKGAVLQGVLAFLGLGLFVVLIVVDYLGVKQRSIYIVWFAVFVCYLMVGLLAAAGRL